jgi:hypothetical protein
MKNTKKMYVSPSVERVLLDHEISLILQSAPPEGPGEPTGELINPANQNPMMA